MNTKEKALALSYILSCLLSDNLDVVLLEMRDNRDDDAGKMQHRIEKLRGANKNAFAILERNVGIDDIRALRDDIEKVLEELWG